VSSMTSRERMMVALRNGVPDRVPVSPGFSDMVPARLSGHPTWDLYLREDPPLWRAYLDALRYYDADGWFIYGSLDFQTRSGVTVDQEVLATGQERWEWRNTYHTPDGDLTERLVCPWDVPPTAVEKLVKDWPEDFKCYRHLFSEVVSCDDSLFQEQRCVLGEQGMMAATIVPPGLHKYQTHFNGNLEAVTYAYYDHPELFEELREIDERQCLQMLSMAIDAGADSILTGGSGALTLQSPTLWRKLTLPTLKKITRMCREAGVISGVHTCGKERYVVQVCADETDLDYIHPLETPPMGDCDLAEVKRSCGHRLALMGNLHTTSVMLFGSPDDVRRASLQAILDAGQGGGFVLANGDQIGRDTPDANVFAMVEMAHEYGAYPLDVGRIQDRLAQIGS
jgi:uroporphyrinogen decarboxylase